MLASSTDSASATSTSMPVIASSRAPATTCSVSARVPAVGEWWTISSLGIGQRRAARSADAGAQQPLDLVGGPCRAAGCGEPRGHPGGAGATVEGGLDTGAQGLSLIHISEPTRLRRISYAVFCLKKKK